MILLIFSCSSYLRYQGSCLITDSAYGFLCGMVFLHLWSVLWVTSFRLSSRRGFRGIVDIKNAYVAKSSRDKKKDSIKKDSGLSKGKKKDDHFNQKHAVRPWDSLNTNSEKGSSFVWKSNIEVLSGVRCNTWLTAVMDSKLCQRLHNFLGRLCTKKMKFQEYKDSGESEVK